MLVSDNARHTDRCDRGIRDLNADKGAARYRRFYSYGMRRKRKFKIVLEPQDPLKLHAFCRLQSVSRNGRTDGYLVHLNINSEIRECPLNKIRVRFHIPDVRLSPVFFKEIERGRGISISGRKHSESGFFIEGSALFFSAAENTKTFFLFRFFLLRHSIFFLFIFLFLPRLLIIVFFLVLLFVIVVFDLFLFLFFREKSLYESKRKTQIEHNEDRDNDKRRKDDTGRLVKKGCKRS